MEELSVAVSDNIETLPLHSGSTRLREQWQLIQVSLRLNEEDKAAKQRNKTLGNTFYEACLHNALKK